MKWFLRISIFCILNTQVLGQEFFINSEPASTIPKGSIMPHFFGTYYDEAGVDRLMGAAGLNYGLLNTLTVRLALAGSNHHGDRLPRNIVSHNHGGSGNSILVFDPGIRYDFNLTGLNLFAKYRWLSIDKKKEHLRSAVYAEYSTAKSPHDESESNLLDDNRGYGFGLITTKLKRRFAVSSTIGYVVPFNYSETSFGLRRDIDYGSSVNYSLSFGYLFLPKKYDSYDQTNINLYLEFLGKSFGAIQFSEDGVPIQLVEKAHQAGHYLEVHPGIQRIVGSSSMLELSAGFRLINRSFSHSNPIFKVSWRKILYL